MPVAVAVAVIAETVQVVLGAVVTGEITDLARQEPQILVAAVAQVVDQETMVPQEAPVLL